MFFIKFIKFINKIIINQ